jgi:antitoxin component YwqK of YwqJK toxin-antitoxin module
MKATIVNSIFLAGLFLGCSQSQTVSEGPAFADLPPSAVRTPYPGDESLVKVHVLDINDKIIAEGDYLNEQKEGSWTEYYPTGVVKMVTSYVKGKKQGPQVIVDENGQVTEKAYFYDGQLHGTYVKYNRKSIKEERTYQFGKLNGMLRLYHDNGKLMEESPYENGVREGIAKWYNTDGEVTIEYLYRNGEWIKDE